MAKRPFLFIALTFGSGIVIQYYSRLSLPVSSIAFVLFLLLTLTLFKTKTSKPANQTIDLLLLGLCFCVGMIRTNIEILVPPKDISHWVSDTDKILLYGTITGIPEEKNNRWRFNLAAKRIAHSDSGWQGVKGQVIVSGQNFDDLAVDDEIVLKGKLKLPSGPRNPGAFDYRAYLHAQGITSLFYSSGQDILWHNTQDTGFSISRITANIRVWIQKNLANYATGQRLALINGLIIGQRQDIDEHVIENFARTGLIHILAVSGLHVGFIVLILVIVADLIRIPKKWQWIFILSGIFCYVHLTGLKPPVIRAATMAALILIGSAFERKTNIYNSLGAAAVFILFWQPLQLFQLGFQLSFAAVAGIACLYQPLLTFFTRLIPLRFQALRWTLALLAVSLAAQLATLPFSITAFGRLPITAIWGNLVVIPAAFLLVATSALACIFAPVSNFVAEAYGAVANLISFGLIDFTDWLAQIPFAFIEGISMPPLLIVIYILGIAILVERRQIWKKRFFFSVLFIINVYVWIEAWQEKPKLRITFFDVGQGDAALLEFSNKQRLLIDAGPWYGNSSAGEHVLKPYFFQHGIRHLDGILISHPHADHLGGLSSILKTIPVDTVYHCGIEINSKMENANESLMDSLQIAVKALHAGDRLNGFSYGKIEVLYPYPDQKHFHNINNASVVIKVLFGKTSVLFTGDAEIAGERRMLQFSEVLDSDLLKVGHHGSRTSSTQAFLNAVTPIWAVASMGRSNKFNHPHSTVVERYDSLGIDFIRTDLNGAVVFETDGQSWQRLR